jgi:hypothetical protein
MKHVTKAVQSVIVLPLRTLLSTTATKCCRGLYSNDTMLKCAFMLQTDNIYIHINVCHLLYYSVPSSELIIRGTFKKFPEFYYKTLLSEQLGLLT